ncbi:signal recognition particle-docking protein FtsY, partial [bacterium]|nr:signal recognition particle-docking protein FtsY [bacterium]
MADNIFSKWKEGLDRTRKSTFGRIATMFGATEIKADTWDELEELLIQADLGVETTMRLMKKLKTQTQELGLTKSSELQQILHDELLA